MATMNQILLAINNQNEKFDAFNRRMDQMENMVQGRGGQWNNMGGDARRALLPTPNENINMFDPREFPALTDTNHTNPAMTKSPSDWTQVSYRRGNNRLNPHGSGFLLNRNINHHHNPPQGIEPRANIPIGNVDLRNEVAALGNTNRDLPEVAGLLYKGVQNQHHLSNWTSVPKHIDRSVSEMLDTLNPPSPDSAFREAIKSTKEKILTLIKDTVVDHMQKNASNIQTTLSRCCPFDADTVVPVVRKHLVQKFGRKLRIDQANNVIHAGIRTIGSARAAVPTGVQTPDPTQKSPEASQELTLNVPSIPVQNRFEQLNDTLTPNKKRGRGHSSVGGTPDPPPRREDKIPRIAESPSPTIETPEFNTIIPDTYPPSAHLNSEVINTIVDKEVEVNKTINQPETDGADNVPEIMESGSSEKSSHHHHLIIPGIQPHDIPSTSNSQPYAISSTSNSLPNLIIVKIDDPRFKPYLNGRWS